MLRAVLLAASVVMSCPAAAGFLTGGKLVEMCRIDETICGVYIIGSIDMVLLIGEAQNKKFICLPELMVHKQASATVRKYLEDNPQLWHLNAAGLVSAALNEYYKCP